MQTLSQPQFLYLENEKINSPHRIVILEEMMSIYEIAEPQRGVP